MQQQNIFHFTLKQTNIKIKNVLLFMCIYISTATIFSVVLYKAGGLSCVCTRANTHNTAVPELTINILVASFFVPF